MSLQPERLNFTIWKGATFRNRLVLYTDEGHSPWPLTDYTADLTIREAPGSNVVLLVLNDANGRITLGGTAGTIDLMISSTDTNAITWEQGAYDLLISAPDNGDTDVLVWGYFRVKGV